MVIYTPGRAEAEEEELCTGCRHWKLYCTLEMLQLTVSQIYSEDSKDSIPTFTLQLISAELYKRPNWSCFIIYIFIIIASLL